jgi:hypothetical protein
LEENNMSNHQSSAAFFAPQAAGENSTSSWGVARATHVPVACGAACAADPTTDGRAINGIMGGMQTVSRTQPAFPDVAVHPGEFLSPAVVERERMRNMLITSIHRFAAETAEAYRITPETAEAAVALIKAFRNSMQLPKIAPDGEGGLMAVWEGEYPPIALVVDNWKMHIVTGAATAHAEYFDDLPFDGVHLPKELLDFVPRS